MLFVLVALVPVLILWLGSRLLPAACSALIDRRDRRAPVGPSLECVVANLRRLRREVRGRTQPTQVRRLAVLAAYDATLLQVCAQVGVDAVLAGAPESERPLARLLTEAALEQAGVALDPPAGSSAAGVTPLQ